MTPKTFTALSPLNRLIITTQNIDTTKGKTNVFIVYETAICKTGIFEKMLNVGIKEVFVFNEIPDYLLDKYNDFKKTRECLHGELMNGWVGE